MFEFLFGITNAVAEATGADAAAVVDAAAATGEVMEEVPVNPVAAMLTSFLPLIIMGVIFYFFLIRPQRKKDKKVKEMLAALKPGDRVTTIGGIYGTIMSIKDETITLAIGSQRTEMVVTRWAIRQVEEVTVENDGEILA